jgi:ribosomal-protein-alanine N-acetyltransferase
LRPPPLPPFDDASVAEVLDRDLRLWEARGSGPWQLDLADGTPAGRAGLAASTIGGEDVVELVWTITPTLWGRGLATEAGTAALATAATLGVGEVVAVTLPANRASQRVMEKLGLRWDGDVIHAGLPHVRYRSGAIRSTPRGARG